jgi:hypothetical protein
MPFCCGSGASEMLAVASAPTAAKQAKKRHFQCGGTTLARRAAIPLGEPVVDGLPPQRGRATLRRHPPRYRREVLLSPP